LVAGSRPNKIGLEVCNIKFKIRLLYVYIPQTRSMHINVLSLLVCMYLYFSN